MKIIIARHAEAKKHSPDGSDYSRKLKEKGKKDIKKISNFLKNTPFRITKIYHSPYIRTKSTAKLFNKFLNLHLELNEINCLAPGENCFQICNILQEETANNSETILMVSHNPEVSFLAEKLLGGNAKDQFIFTPGSILIINISKEKLLNGKVLCFLSPELIE